MSNTKKEQDDDTAHNGDTQCPPGMKKDADGKCVKEEFNKEEDNAGDTTNKGMDTLVDASDTPNPSDTHDCPEGTTWNVDKGICEPTGDPAGMTGGAGTGAADTPGKENARLYKMLERLMASHSVYNQELLETFKNGQQKYLESLTASMGIPTYSKESASFGVKRESAASSMVNDSGFKTTYEKTVVEPANWFEQIKTNTNAAGDYFAWRIQPDGYYKTLPQGWMNYGSTAAHVPIKQDGSMKGEAFTITAGDMPQIFSKQVYLIPGGRMRVPIRQFLDTQIIEDSDRFNWFKVNGFDFDDTTAEGTAPTAESQTITKITGTPTATRALQVVNYSDIENAPFDLIEAFNRAAALGAIDAEAKEVLDTTYDAITPTNWVNGNTGTVITGDDLAAVTTLKQEGVYGAQDLIMDQGGDISPGNMVFFVDPTPLREIIVDTANDFFTQQGPLHATALGVLENRLGVDIVPTNKVTKDTQTTTNVHRNILAMKGSIGLVVAADLQIEAQRRPDLAAVNVGARHRIDGAIIDETMTCRISTEQ